MPLTYFDGEAEKIYFQFTKCSGSYKCFSIFPPSEYKKMKIDDGAIATSNKDPVILYKGDFSKSNWSV